MPALSQPYGLGLTGGDAIAFGPENPDDQFAMQSWPLRYPLAGQFEFDNPLTDDAETVDFSSISAAPEAVRLRRSLHIHGQTSETTAVTVLRRTSILDFPLLNLGAVLRPLGPDDDLLGEMLDEARS
jgi:hypothetical protein